MLEVRLIGKVEIQCDGQPITISSRIAQSLLAYLILNAGTSYRREKLAGIFWPDTTEEKARAYLRHELWRIRKALSAKSKFNYFTADDLNISFNSSNDYWLDVAALKNTSVAASIDELMNALSLFQGELLPGFYDEWIILEREHLEAIYERHMSRLLGLLEKEKRWNDILEWADRWISFGHAPEMAYRTLMTAYDALGDGAKVASTYERCVHALRELDLEPSEQTQALVFKRSSSLNIPIPLTSFIGRERELKEVVDLLSKSRLVTLTGAGGVGKTRLAIQVVAEVLELFPDGVWFLDLAPLNDPALVPNTLANVLGLHESGELPITDILINYFHSRTSLAIFDNCEHLIESCAQLIHSLLSSCEHLSIFATSREALRVSGEIPYRVPSLEIPNIDAKFGIDEFSNIESMKLFVERAAITASSRFILSSQNALVIAQICQWLDGIPLAIELAAARTDILTLEQILKRLDDRFNLLTSGSRTARPRHQTLRATIDWSYDLLSEKERLLLRRLAVFAGGWTLEAAESVCSDASVKPDDVLDLLAQLIKKSLVNMNELQSETRYGMLETIRQYAKMNLVASNEINVLRNRHLDYFLNMAEIAAPHLMRSEQLEWLARLDADYENLRAALEWALGKKSSEYSLRLCSALGPFWYVRAYWLEGSKWLKSAFSKSSPSPGTAGKTARVKALYQDACLAGELDDIERMKASANLSLLLAQEGTDTLDIAIARFYKGLALFRHNKSDDALQLMEQSLTEFRELDDPYWEAYAFRHLGYLLEMQGKIKVGAWYLQSVELARRAGERLNLAEALWSYSYLFYYSYRSNEITVLEEIDGLYKQIGSRINKTSLAFATIAWLNGDYAEARTYFLEFRELLSLVGEKAGKSQVTSDLGRLTFEQGDLDQAQTYFEEALTTAREQQMQPFISLRLAELSNVFYLQKNIDGYKQILKEGIDLAKMLSTNMKLYFLLIVLNSLHIQNPESCIRILAAIHAFERESECPIPPLEKRYYDQAETRTRGVLGNAAFDSIFAERQRISIDEALDLTMSIVEEM
jgi:predicted ATPase/DNA-binding SARP family transcriptional activator